jgi:hypothetical protein
MLSESGTPSIEMVHRMVDRRLWWALVIVAVVAFSVQAFALKVLSTPRAVVAFDSTGRPLVFTDTHKAAIPDEGRVRAFVMDFLENYVGVDGHGFDGRMVKALRMMTDELRRTVVSSLRPRGAPRRHLRGGHR